MRRASIPRAIVAGLATMLVPAGAALATATLRSGALYTAKSPACATPAPGMTCVFRFRAAPDGLSLRFVGKTVIDSWSCTDGGGGEALLGGKLNDATPIPKVRVRANGTLYGSVNYTFRPTMAPPEHHRSTVTGHLASGGRAAVVTFHNIYLSRRGSFPCATRPVRLTAH